jgi:hypothetical protein
MTKAPESTQWRLRSGLLYAGLNDRCQCILTTADQAVVFDGRDNEQAKAAFYGQMLHTQFEIELCPAS